MILVSLASPISTHLSYDAPNPAGHILCSVRSYHHYRSLSYHQRQRSWLPCAPPNPKRYSRNTARPPAVLARAGRHEDPSPRSLGASSPIACQNLHSSPHTRSLMFRFRQRHRIRSAISDTVTSTDPELGLYYS
ncbi:hypothetical protein NEOLEDRAFT_172408 [Neolentinus lepideus HHB14362 ss-1]|uniref:Uncharacterized protein n=1 Tax=Neolentinus lepideus HHB14362 ss-1 TaxID=1314782 RepID=A0A165MIX7_9AGAM|nr:hypothetical protein NEOLEDRAFT_172408 [Neolentinus lepideus HHB14362 ss-1]